MEEEPACQSLLLSPELITRQGRRTLKLATIQLVATLVKSWLLEDEK